MKIELTTLLFLITLLPGLTLAQTHPKLVAHYAFDEGNATDYVGKGGNGIIYGVPKFIPGVVGQAIYFDGGDHRIIFPGRINRYLRSTRDFSISFFFRSTDLRNIASLMSKRHVCKGVNMFDIRVGKNLGVELYEREYPRIRTNVGTAIQDGQWHHYVYVRKANRVWLYKDGVLVDKKRGLYVIGISDLTDFAINNSPCKGVDGTANLAGALDELKIYKKALSPKEVQRLLPRPPASSRLQKGRLDPRMKAIFGQYFDRTTEQPSQLELKAQNFQLTISEPVEYNYQQQIILRGKYRIKGGKLHLEGKELIVGEKKLPYRGPEIVGDIYGEIVIDLVAFETRLKFRKAE